MTVADQEARAVRVVAIVEDHPDMRDLLRLLLRREKGFEVEVEARSGTEALELVVDGDEDGVIVLDQSLEGPLTGLELAPLLKERRPNVRIVLFSAFDLASEAAASPAVDGFVRKDRVSQLPAVLRSLAGH